jgi:hypothetical protein
MVLLIDYTYNINNFNMPLFIIIKLILIIRFFIIKIAFLNKEKIKEF